MNEAAGQIFESYEIQRLLELLPHRYPFLLVDRIVEARALLEPAFGPGGAPESDDIGGMGGHRGVVRSQKFETKLNRTT